MIFIHLILLLGGYFLGRARTEFRGTEATTESDLVYTFEVDRDRGGVTSRTFGVTAERLPTLGFWRERWTDRFFKFVRLVREFSCDDVNFDAKVFVACSNPAVREALVRSAPLRQAVMRLLDAGAMLIECNGKTVWAQFPATFDEGRVDAVVADLSALASGFSGLTDGDAELQTMRVEGVLRGIAAAASALAVVGSAMMMFHDGYWLADGYAFFFRLFPASMLAWLVFLVAIVGALAGRSARAHRLFVAGLFAGVFVAPLALFIAARDVNVALDFSPAQASLLPIVDHKVERVKESRWSDDKTRHTYAVVKAPAPDLDPLDVEVDYEPYMQVLRGEIDRATVHWHAGSLGAPWIESVTLGAPHAAAAKRDGGTEDDTAGRDAACTGGDLAACNLLGVSSQTGDADQAVHARVSLRDMLNQIMTPQELDAPRWDASGPQGQSSPLHFNTDLMVMDSKALCQTPQGKCKDLTAAAVCNEAEKKIAGHEYSENFPFVAGRNFQEKRFVSKDLRRKIFSYTYQQLKSIKENPELQARCCRGDSECVRSFVDLDLYLVMGLPSDDYSGRFILDRQNPRLEYSEAFLLNCRTDASIRQSLFHEVGHACQVFRNKFGLDPTDCKGAEIITKNDFKIDFGKDATECVTTRLKAGFDHYTLNNPEAGACFGRWMMEAYGDAIFMDQWEKPTAFSSRCGDRRHSTDDAEHGPSEALECIMNQPPFRSSFCGQIEECKN